MERIGRKPQQARAFEKKALILQHALEFFAAHGFDGANVRDIARAAGTTHSMITYHFGTKEELWQEAVSHMFNRLNTEIQLDEAATQNLSEVERYRCLIRNYVRYCARHPEHFRITIAETIRGGERLKWMVEKYVKEGQRSHIVMAERLMEAGILRRMPIVSFIYCFVGMAQLPFVLAKEARFAFDCDTLTEDFVNRHAEAVMSFLIGEEGAAR